MADDAAFDQIMEMADDDGPFQKRFNYIFNAGLVICASMVYMNLILALNAPEHWCHVPGREFTNYTIDEWKTLTLPRETNTRGVSSFSKCKMYNVSTATIMSENLMDQNFSRFGVVECQAYEYDKRWYEYTLVSQEDWVCSKDLYQTNTFVFNRIGEMIGTFFFGQLGDTLGRRIIFYLSLLLLLLGRILTILTPSHYMLFAGASIIGSLSACSIFQSPYIIGMEIVKPSKRANIAIFQSTAWTIGMCIMPMVFWLVRDWISFIAITTAPLIFFAFFPKYMIESPRWLASRGQLDKAAKCLSKIAKINGKSITINEKLLRSRLSFNEAEKVYGMLSLFSGWRLAKNTVILITCWIICTIGYFTLILYIAQMDGNPFLNFLLQSVVEVPAFLLGAYLGNKIGRRLTNFLSFLMCAVFCVPTILLIHTEEYQFASTTLITIVKFWSTITFFAINLQAMETYPTCLRQTGISIGMIFSNAFGILGPYISYLGTRYDSRYPIAILMSLFIVGSLCGLFLPETLNQKLPDSLDEARLFGRDQPFWGLPKPQKPKQSTNDSEADNEEMVRLKQAQFAP